MSLDRFLLAQTTSYEGAFAELRAGEKRGHWIWWVFPQLKGLGSSPNSTYYGLDDEAEARAYLNHPVLGARYRDCVEAVYRHLCERGVAPLTLMGSDTDVIKLRSSLELFRKVAQDGNVGLCTEAEVILSVLG